MSRSEGAKVNTVSTIGQDNCKWKLGGVPARLELPARKRVMNSSAGCVKVAGGENLGVVRSLRW